MIEQYLRDERHRRSEEHAFRAERAARGGDLQEAATAFAEAAALEEQVARAVPLEAARVRTVLAVSAVSLWVRARRWIDAGRAACSFLADPQGLTPDGRRDLEIRAEKAWRARDLQSESSTLQGYAPLEAKLDGGAIRRGIAPSHLVSERRDVLVPLVMRVAEWQGKKKFRKAGTSSYASKLDIVEVPALAASYTVRLFIGASSQLPTPTEPQQPEALVRAFLQIAAAAAHGASSLKKLVPDEDYSRAFLRGFRDLAADGPLVATVELSSGGYLPNDAPVALYPQVREKLSSALQSAGAAEKIEVRGVLKSINLRGTPFISIDTDDVLRQSRKLKLRPGEHDDTIGPKLNRRVHVSGWHEAGDEWADDIELLEDEPAPAPSLPPENDQSS